jgi:ABC-type amino acid transport system permease subunit
MTADTQTLRLSRLHALAAALDVAGLTMLMFQALYFIPPAQADRRILLLILCVVPVALALFLLVPRRAGLLRETHTSRRSLMVTVTLGVPVTVSLLTLLLVGASGSFDSFAGFALLLAADTGRNLCEWLRNR